MYLRFSDRAREVMKIAEREAIETHHDVVLPEHILLALLAEGSGVGAKILRSIGLDLETIHSQVAASVSVAATGQQKLRPPLSDLAELVIESATRESRALGHNYVGTEHLLLGLFHQRDGVTFQLLTNSGQTLDSIRREVLTNLGEIRREVQNPMCIGFTDRARQVMQLADREARQCHHDFVGPEHIVLGLLAEGEGLAAHVLKHAGLDLEKLRSRVACSEAVTMVVPETLRLPPSDAAKLVIAASMNECRALGHNYVGTEHLLLGLCHRHDGLAFQLLTASGLTLEGIRREVLQLLGLDA